MAYAFALALAVALIDVTVGYPAALAQRIGSPPGWLDLWLRVVVAAAGRWRGRAALALYLLPALVGAAAVAQILPGGPLGFAATAFVASTLTGRQRIDARAKATARAWEEEGPRAALAVAEPLRPDEGEPRLDRACAAALAARFADEAVAPTVFILIGGLVGAALATALALAARRRRETRDESEFGRATEVLERWTLAPCARLAALILALASVRPGALAAVTAAAPVATAPAETAMLAAVGRGKRTESEGFRRALALFRRAAALEIAGLAALAWLAAFAL